MEEVSTSLAAEYAKHAGIDISRLNRILTPQWSPYIPHVPFSTQLAYLLLDCREAFYGGAGGGGKSDALIMAALQYVHIPNYSALILRRTYADLAKPNAIMDRAKRWLVGRPGVKWNEKDKTFTFDSGAVLVFGYMDTENDKYQYQGAEFQFVAFDELTQFTKSMYQYLFTRLRRLKNSTIPIRMRAASNPGGVGHEWVKQRFIPCREDRYLTPDLLERKKKRIFIPAKIEDNPHLDADEYIESLEETDAVLQAQMRSGNWDMTEGGGKFDRAWFDNKFIRMSELPKLKKVIRYWDTAGTDPDEVNKDPDFAAGVLMAKGVDNNYYVIDVARKKGNPGIIEQFMLATAEHDTIITGHRGKFKIIIEEEPGSQAKFAIRSIRLGALAGYSVRGVKSQGKGTKQVRANPFASACFNGDVYIVRADWNEPYLTELSVFPLKGFHDDMVDASSGAYTELHSRRSLSVGAVSDAEARVVQSSKLDDTGIKKTRKIDVDNMLANVKRTW